MDQNGIMSTGGNLHSRILVICTGNRARSQMAEGWLRHLGGGAVEVCSAGTQPKGVHPLAIEVMEAVGIDLRTHRSEHVSAYEQQAFDLVVTVCDNARESCPVFPNATRALHQPFEDPDDPELSRGELLEVFARVRDEIETWAKELLESMGLSPLPPEAEHKLVGGLVDRVVQVGRTVRRPAGAWSKAVSALLDHLEAKNFPAPRSRGTDAQGRDVVTYLTGEASLWPWPDVLRKVDGIHSLGRMLRRYHEAVADFVPPASCIWQAGEKSVAEGEVVCHGDLNPSNLIWEGTTLVGFIDWEQAYPAPPLLDLADAAWKTTPLCPDEELTKLGFPKPPDRAERLAVLARGYGLSDPRAVLDNVRVLQEREHRRIIELGQAGREPWRTFLEGGLAERTVRDQRWLESNYTALLSA